VQGIVDGVRDHLSELKRNGRVDLHLDLTPPELGRVRVQMTATEHEVRVRLVVQDDNARAMLQNQADVLRERLGGLGVSLGHLDVRRDGTGSGYQDRQPPPETAASPPRVPPVARPKVAAPLRPSGGVNLIA
jgi:flagellar hook-length control protein FliK